MYKSRPGNLHIAELYLDLERYGNINYVSLFEKNKKGDFGKVYKWIYNCGDIFMDHPLYTEVAI